MLDTTLRQIERGEITWVEGLDQLLLEDQTLRDKRRMETSLRMTRLHIGSWFQSPSVCDLQVDAIGSRAAI